MRVFLDENMPHDLVGAIRAKGYEVESVHTLGITGVKNGELYQMVRDKYDLLFTKDAGFNEWAKKLKESHRIKFVFVTLPQKSQDFFVKDFMTKFSKTDWAKHIHGSVWPK